MSRIASLCGERFTHRVKFMYVLLVGSAVRSDSVGLPLQHTSHPTYNMCVSGGIRDHFHLGSLYMHVDLVDGTSGHPACSLS